MKQVLQPIIEKDGKYAPPTNFDRDLAIIWLHMIGLPVMLIEELVETCDDKPPQPWERLYVPVNYEDGKPPQQMPWQLNDGFDEFMVWKAKERLGCEDFDVCCHL